jgi:hypothetical protein
VARIPKSVAPKSEAAPTQPSATEVAETAATKGHATPTRKQQEAARKQPLVPSDRKLAGRQSREQIAVQRDRARVGQARGEEKYLQLRDKGPQKRYVRDFVDARFSLGEVLLPILVVVILTYFLPAQFSSIALIAVWGVIILVVADGLYLGARVSRGLADKFGGKDKVEKGVRWYAFMRAIQLRPMRLPKPQVKRGQFPS